MVKSTTRNFAIACLYKKMLGKIPLFYFEAFTQTADNIMNDIFHVVNSTIFEKIFRQSYIILFSLSLLLYPGKLNSRKVFLIIFFIISNLISSKHFLSSGPEQTGTTEVLPVKESAYALDKRRKKRFG